MSIIGECHSSKGKTLDLTQQATWRLESNFPRFDTLTKMRSYLTVNKMFSHFRYLNLFKILKIKYCIVPSPLSVTFLQYPLSEIN
jgi:hypothetical protein